MVTKAKAPDETHKQKLTYSLTEKSIDLLPMLLEAIALRAGGPAALEGFRKKLIAEHVKRANP